MGPRLPPAGHHPDSSIVLIYIRLTPYRIPEQRGAEGSPPRAPRIFPLDASRTPPVFLYTMKGPKQTLVKKLYAQDKPKQVLQTQKHLSGKK